VSDASIVPGLVVVTVATYRRPEMLAQCLDSLREQDLVGRFVVVVVDNDPEGSARQVVRAADGLDVTYAVEAVPGIAAARNRCVDIALTFDPDWIAFVDDDEWASPGWLRELVSAALIERADGAQGWVKSIYRPGTPDWVRELRFGERPKLARGTALRTAATNNLLVRAAILARVHPAFDVDLGLVGTDDTKMTAAIVRDGANLVAAPDAVVFEEVPPERQSLEWMRRRARRGAAGWVDIERTVLRSPYWRTRRVISGLRHYVRGILFGLWGLLASDELRTARGRIDLARAWGTVVGLAGRQIQEYGR
jgi:succinoglycan biosynthesis protein ExoM